jgi:hypothetical protein
VEAVLPKGQCVIMLIRLITQPSEPVLWNGFDHSSLFLTLLKNFSVLCADVKQAVAVKSQLQKIARAMYSNPPVHGIVLVSTILKDPQTKALWIKEVKVMYTCLSLSYWFLFFSLPFGVGRS